jgi:hypothetical protein
MSSGSISTGSDETMQMLAGRELELATVQSRLSSRVTALERENERRAD